MRMVAQTLNRGETHVYFILGIILMAAGWKLKGMSHDDAVKTGATHFPVFHGLFVAGGLSFIKGPLKMGERLTRAPAHRCAGSFDQSPRLAASARFTHTPNSGVGV
jgi:hypothetical protein